VLEVGRVPRGPPVSDIEMPVQVLWGGANLYYGSLRNPKYMSHGELGIANAVVPKKQKEFLLESPEIFTERIHAG